MARRLRWDVDGRDWPNRESSRFVEAGGIVWHVQVLGDGPVLFLAHGTGASTHSWRDLAPHLAAHFTVVAPDLPGHAFTQTPPSQALSLPVMAALAASLLRKLEMDPSIVAGHSAGAAILARMCIDGRIPPRALVSLNGALTPMRGISGRVFSPVAKLLATSSVAPRLFAWRAGEPGVVERLVRDTGSQIDARGTELYGRLARSPAHVAAALAMMANWDLAALQRDLPRLGVPVLLVAGGDDRAIAPHESFRLRKILPDARVEYLRGLGHLAHEEKPEVVANVIIGAARELNVLAPA